MYVICMYVLRARYRRTMQHGAMRSQLALVSRSTLREPSVRHPAKYLEYATQRRSGERLDPPRQARRCCSSHWFPPVLVALRTCLNKHAPPWWCSCSPFLAPVMSIKNGSQPFKPGPSSLLPDACRVAAHWRILEYRPPDGLVDVSL